MFHLVPVNIFWPLFKQPIAHIPKKARVLQGPSHALHSSLLLLLVCSCKIPIRHKENVLVNQTSRPRLQEHMHSSASTRTVLCSPYFQSRPMSENSLLHHGLLFFLIGDLLRIQSLLLKVVWNSLSHLAYGHSSENLLWPLSLCHKATSSLCPAAVGPTLHATAAKTVAPIPAYVSLHVQLINSENHCYTTSHPHHDSSSLD